MLSEFQRSPFFKRMATNKLNPTSFCVTGYSLIGQFILPLGLKPGSQLVFGCRSIVHIHMPCTQSQSDLQPKSIPQQLASELLPLCLYKCFQSRVVAKLEELVEADNSQFINYNLMLKAHELQLRQRALFSSDRASFSSKWHKYSIYSPPGEANVQ